MMRFEQGGRGTEWIESNYLSGSTHMFTWKQEGSKVLYKSDSSSVWDEGILTAEQIQWSGGTMHKIN